MNLEVLLMKKSKFTGEHIAYAMRRADLGASVAEVCRKMGITPVDEAPDFSFWADTNTGQGQGNFILTNNAVLSLGDGHFRYQRNRQYTEGGWND